MKKLTILFILLLVGIFPAHMQDATPSITIPNTQVIEFTSRTNERNYRISVALPASYDGTGQTYPVIYVLDPLTAFLTTTELTRFMYWAKEFPEVIVVGIGYPTDDLTETLTPREFDYHIRKDNFIAFFEAELFPLIESTYGGDNEDRALIGFSYGGEFVFYTLAHRADLFSRYIAIDGADASELISRVMRNDEDFRNQFVGRDVRVFITSAGTEYFSAAIQAKDYEGLNVSGLSLGNVTHAQTLPLSLSNGILWIYAD